MTSFTGQVHAIERLTMKIRVIYVLNIANVIKKWAKHNNAEVIIFITRIMLEIVLKSRVVLDQVSSDLGEVNSFYSLSGIGLTNV